MREDYDIYCPSRFLASPCHYYWAVLRQCPRRRSVWNNKVGWTRMWVSRKHTGVGGVVHLDKTCSRPMRGQRSGLPESSCSRSRCRKAARKRQPGGTLRGGSVGTEDSRRLPRGCHDSGAFACPSCSWVVSLSGASDAASASVPYAVAGSSGKRRSCCSNC